LECDFFGGWLVERADIERYNFFDFYFGDELVIDKLVIMVKCYR
jgi:hypothetical protein